MKITICVGSSCHIKGSRQVIEQIQSLIEERSLQDQIEIAGSFCMGNCMNGVSVKIEDKMFSLQPDNTKQFFEDEVMKRVSTK